MRNEFSVVADEKRSFGIASTWGPNHTWDSKPGEFWAWNFTGLCLGATKVDFIEHVASTGKEEVLGHWYW